MGWDGMDVSVDKVEMHSYSYSYSYLVSESFLFFGQIEI